MSKVEEVSVSVRFSGDDLEPDRLTHLLQCDPTEAFRKGDEVRGYAAIRPAKTGVWNFEIPWNAPQDVELQITYLLDLLPEDLQIWSQVLEIHRGELYCVVVTEHSDMNQGFSLSPKLIQRISERGLRLEVRLYCHEEMGSGASLDSEDVGFDPRFHKPERTS